MRRVHQLPSSAHIVFMDSSSSCDADNHCITFLLAPTAAGCAPLAVGITQGQSAEDYTRFLSILNDCLPKEERFGGKGFPGIVMRDDASK